MNEYCNGKVRYESEKAAKKMRNIRGKSVENLRVYYHDLCHGYHLTKERKI